MEQFGLDSAQLFAEVARLQSFTAAASALGMPKSTLSRKVSELESRLGARLLQRTTRKLRLTDVGAAYYERVTRLLSEFAEAEAAVAETQNQPRGLLRVTVPPDLGNTVVAWTIPEFSRTYPDVEIELDISSHARDLIAEGFDVALRATKLTDSSLVARPIFSGTFALYAHPHYLDQRGRPSAVHELSEHDCVVFGSSPERTWTLSNGSEEHRVSVRGRLAAADYSYLRMTTVAGAGIALLPTFLVGPDVHQGRLERVLPDYSQESDRLFIVYPSRAFLSAKVRAFVDFMIQQFTQWDRVCGSACKKIANNDAPFI